MLVSEIPEYFIQITPSQWSDPNEQDMYFLDPTDATMLVSRGWTATELADYNQKLAEANSVVTTLDGISISAIKKLKDGIGPKRNLPDGTANPELIPGSTSINAILADTKANINANPSAYINFIVKDLKDIHKALISVIKLSQGLTEDADVGAE